MPAERCTSYFATVPKASVKEIMREMKKLKIALEGDKWVVQNKIKCVRELADKIGFDIPKYITVKNRMGIST